MITIIITICVIFLLFFLYFNSISISKKQFEDMERMVKRNDKTQEEFNIKNYTKEELSSHYTVCLNCGTCGMVNEKGNCCGCGKPIQLPLKK